MATKPPLKPALVTPVKKLTFNVVFVLYIYVKGLETFNALH